MKFKHMLFVLTVTTSIIFACMLGSSYAYYTLSNGTTVTATTGEFDANVSVVFSESEYINLKTGVPINSTDVDKYASASKFTLIPDATKLQGYDVAVKIAISNITIDTELKISDFKYDLKCNDGSSTTTIKSGTGADFTSTELEIGTLSTQNSTFNVSKTYNCALRLWLQETGSNQNSLMNKSFSGLIKVNSVYRK
jgi:lipoprotein